MKASFVACLKNLLPFLVYGVILFVLCLIAMIPIGLGMLIMVPVMIKIPTSEKPRISS